MKKGFLLKLLLVTGIIFTSDAFGQAPRSLPNAYSGTEAINYVRSWDAVKPTKNPNDLSTSVGLQDGRMTTLYLDGLGRQVQTVVKQGSMATGSSATDFINLIEYDQFGRERFKYLPAAASGTGGNTSISDGMIKNNPFQQQQTFYNTYLNGQNGEVVSSQNWAYNQVNLEASPLNRLQETFAAGVNWVGTQQESLESDRHSQKTKYWFNTIYDSVRVWNVSVGSIGSLSSYSSSGEYASGDLYKGVKVDENNKQVIEFKDKEGRLILRKVQLSSAADDGGGKGHYGWLCTYFLYDALGNLRCILQPEGVVAIASTWVLTNSTILYEQCVRYEYDERNRKIIEKNPGAGEVYIVYDNWDRAFLRQDAVQRENYEYTLTKYDQFNRPIITANYQYEGTIAQVRDAANDPGYRFEERVSSGGNGSGYTSRCWPDDNYTILTVAYYDDYSWLSAVGNPLPSVRSNTDDSYFLTTGNTYPYPESVTQSNETVGLVTGTKTLILGTNDYLFSTHYYDSKGRLIQVMKHNITGGLETLTTQYGWQGWPLLTISRIEKQGSNTQTTVVVSKMTYDDLGRVTKAEKKVAHSQINGGTMPGSWTVITEMEYNALGQLKKKKLAPEWNSNAGLDSLTYDYNIRGWLLGINRLFARDVHQDNFFGFDLGYDKTNNNIINSQTYASAQYNGSITGMVWKSKGDGEKRKYDFIYDGANRLLAADFNQYTGSTFNKTAGVDYSMRLGNGSDPATAYDANSNIKAMYQKGWTVGGSTTIDDLVYEYLPNSNKLKYVYDQVNSVDSKKGDFKESVANYDANTISGTADFAYDLNGNLVKDLNKDVVTYDGSEGVEYNFLNLPSKITVKKDALNNKGYIEYTYDAVGNKLKKITYEPGVDTTELLYLSGNVYRNDTLEFIQYEEGRIRKKDAGELIFDYMLKDHLGNVRMLLTTERDTSFYPAASHETANLNTERLFYGGVDTGRVATSSYVNYPSGGWLDGPSSYFQKLNGNGPSVGSNMVLKVMAGDQVSLYVNYWYEAVPRPGTPVNPFNSVVSALLSGVGGLANSHNGIAINDLESNNVFDPTVTTFLSGQSGYVSTRPKAFLNWILLDEQFNFVNSNSGSLQVEEITFGMGAKLMVNNHQIAKSGYLFVYVSNESPNADVFFDNLKVTHIRGPILEESHYYPFGLSMHGISNSALSFGDPANRVKYNSIEQNTSLSLNTYEAYFRQLDPQIGRWWSIDPKLNYNISPYASMENNPILNSDPLGDTIIVTPKFDKDGNVNGLTITLEGKVIFKKEGVTEKRKNGFVKDLNSRLKKFFSNKKYNVDFVSNLTIGTEDELKSSDHAVYVTESAIDGKEAFVNAIGGKKLYMGSKDIGSVDLHEFGHILGLNHTQLYAAHHNWDYRFDPSNFMTENYETGQYTEMFESPQYWLIYSSYQNGYLNDGDNKFDLEYDRPKNSKDRTKTKAFMMINIQALQWYTLPEVIKENWLKL